MVGARCWTRCPPRPGKRMTGPGTSGTTTRWPEAMRRLVAARLLPERAGQPVKVWAHISLADLLRLDGRLGPAGGMDRAGPGPVGGPPRGRVRDRQRRRRLAGRRRRRGHRLRRRDGPHRDRGRQRRRAGRPGPAVRRARTVSGQERRADARPDTARAWAALEQAVIGKAVDLLSGPGRAGQSFLRRRQLGRPAGRAEPAAGHRVRRERSRRGSVTR